MKSTDFSSFVKFAASGFEEFSSSFFVAFSDSCAEFLFISFDFAGAGTVTEICFFTGLWYIGLGDKN